MIRALFKGFLILSIVLFILNLGLVDIEAQESQQMLVIQSDATYLVRWNPVRDLIASSSKNQMSILIWDANTGEQLDRVGLDEAPITAMEWGHDGNLLATLSGNYMVRVWKLEQNGSLTLDLSTNLYETVERDIHLYTLTSIDWNKDCSKLAIANDYDLSVWDIVSNTVLTPVHHQETGYGLIGPIDINWNRDSNKLAMLNSDGTIAMLDGEKFLPVISFPENNESTAPLYATTQAIDWSPDETKLATIVTVVATENEIIRINDASTGEVISSLSSYVGSVYAIEWSQTGNQLASGGEDTSIHIWNITNGRELITVEGHEQPVTSISWSPDGTRLASGSLDGTIRVWQVDG
ncbi:MAG: hypothetical protein DPW16_03555 [Chloroflexi bacterium]|nr:hypothetical protein [Chloroflexota bacterium]